MLGVCGMGMGPLAIYMRQEGWTVSGWDDATQPPMSDFLRQAGIALEKTFDPTTPPALVGHSSAIKPGHPLHALAQTAGVRLVRRGELLAERVREKQLIAVCGSHGKTTTSGMLIQALLAADADIGYVLGGLYRDTTLPPARAAAGPWVVAEVDESDGTINHFSPEITVAVNLDWDHPDYYRTEAELEAVFAALFQRTRRAIFIPEGNARLRRLAATAPVPVFTVGVGAGDFQGRVVASGSTGTRIELGKGFPAGALTLPVAGRFNTTNALTALAVTFFVAGRLGVEPLGKFSGIRRRQDVLFESGGLCVMADYAHHPTEITSLLQFLRERTLGRLVAVFQPHRHTRTRQYAREFATALSIADAALLLPVYSAGEAPVEGGTTESVFEAAGGDARFTLINDEAALRQQLAALAADGTDANGTGGTTLVFIGAGNIDKMAAAYVRDLWLSGARLDAHQHDFGARVRRYLSAASVLVADYPLASKTTIGAGGACAWYAEPTTPDDLRLLLRGAALADLPVFVVGRGSNLLVPDEGFSGLAIRLAHPSWKSVDVRSDGTVHAGGGARLQEIAAKAAQAGLDGFAFMEGIPASLGGALRMNAGAMGAAMFDRVVSVSWLSPDGVLHEQARESFGGAAYRDCAELRGAVVLEAVLQATGAVAPESALAQLRDFAARRRAAQPTEPSAGCSFKNPPANHAGRLIDALGLKGLTAGGASVSSVHANFIVNRGGATASDVIELMRRVRGVVKATHGIELEPEIILVGKEWREVW
jgi:UDP-N-acetylenolpyruvoylglucosamine reductase